MPRTAEAMGVTDPNDPAQNITGGIKYLAELIKKYGSDRPDLVLAGYNAGPGKVAQYNGEVPPFKETQDYIERVMTTYEKLQKNYQLIMQAPPAALTKGAQTP
jgi:soluble lytic murein transglycosylase-like protein